MKNNLSWLLMKITSRIVTGYGILFGLLAGLVGFEMFTIHRMQSVNRSVAGVNFRSAVLCLRLMRDGDLVEEYARKAVALADTGYIAQLRGYREDFEGTLRDVVNSAGSPEERTEANRLTQFWHSFSSDLESRLAAEEKVNIFPQELAEDVERLNAQIQTVYQANLNAIRKSVEDSSKVGEMARLISWCAAAIALVVSALVSFLIYRSISIPLANLTEGTQAIAQGKFFYRLDSSRRDEFAQLARDFNTMTHRLNELDELKKAFVSHVSHELKAPLASIKETIQLMLEQIPGSLNEKQRRLLELNLRSVERLTAMIGNLLDLSKIEAGVMEYELRPRDMASLVRNAISELEGQARERNLKIEGDLPQEPLSVECDGDRIIQVMVNLIGNAVKFSPSGEAVSVRLQAVGQVPPGLPQGRRETLSQEGNGKGFVLVSVSDHGPGVPDPEKEMIFERFHQVRQLGKGSGHGVGLGLTICRTIVEAHGGAIWVENNAPHGSSFQVLLPSGGDGRSVRRASTPI